MAVIASLSGVSQAVLISCRQRKTLLNFENTIRLCRALDIDMNLLADCDYGENDRLLGFSTDSKSLVGSQFWTLLQEFLQGKNISWAEAARIGDVPPSTIGTARINARTLSFDTTLCLLKGLELSPEGFADHLNLSGQTGQLNETDPCAAIKREIARAIKRMRYEDLEKLLDYIKYLNSKV